MDRNRLSGIVVGLLLAASAAFAGAQTSPCASCQTEWAALPALMYPVPNFPAPNWPVWLAIFDPGHQLGRSGVVSIWREAPDPVLIGSGTVNFDRYGIASFQPGGAGLPAGTYVARYFDQLTGPAPGDVPRGEIRFFVSGTGLIDVVEYFNATLGHYFITGDPTEIEKLDTGVIAGWRRTGESFRAFPPDQIPSFAQPVCRFYGLPSAGLDSHFYSASPEECAAVKAKWPDAWIPETDDAFGALGDTYPFDCMHVFRLYNNRPDANHRYTTSTVIRDQMIAQGWILEAAFFPPYDDPYSMCLPSER